MVETKTDPYLELKKQLARFSSADAAKKWLNNWIDSQDTTTTTLSISMPLITHIAYTQNKIKADRLMKINGQRIYDGSLNKFKRAIVVENMHYYFQYNIPQKMLNLNITKVKSIEYVFHTVLNHGNISIRNNKKCWVKPKPNYVPNWDVNNLADIWIKTGNDALSLSKVIIDDNISVINNTTYRFNMVDHIDDLELEVIIKY